MSGRWLEEVSPPGTTVGQSSESLGGGGGGVWLTIILNSLEAGDTEKKEKIVGDVGGEWLRSTLPGGFSLNDL